MLNNELYLFVKRTFFWTYFIVYCLSIILFLIVFSRISSNYPDFFIDQKIEMCHAQLNYLESKVKDGVAYEMQALFPEGFVFTNALYGLSWIEFYRISPENDPRKKKCIQEAKWALDQIETDYGKSIFNESIIPKYGAFYLSWTTWLRGKILSVEDTVDKNSEEYLKFETNCNTITQTYLTERSPYPPSYYNQAWPADAIIGIAALKLSDYYFKTDHRAFINDWLEIVKLKIDTKSRLIPHSVEFDSGYQDESARGSSQSLILRFLYEIDSDFAIDQYLRFREEFYTTVLGFLFFREYSRNYEGIGDVDSGPVLFGAGSASTIVSLGTSRFFSDINVSVPLNTTIETIGMPIGISENRYYLFGKLAIADLFITWSRLSEPMEKFNRDLEFKPLIDKNWKLKFILISFLVLVVNIFLLKFLHMKMLK